MPTGGTAGHHKLSRKVGIAPNETGARTNQRLFMIPARLAPFQALPTTGTRSVARRGRSAGEEKRPCPRSPAGRQGGAAGIAITANSGRQGEGEPAAAGSGHWANLSGGSLAESITSISLLVQWSTIRPSGVRT